MIVVFDDVVVIVDVTTGFPVIRGSCASGLIDAL